MAKRDNMIKLLGGPMAALEQDQSARCTAELSGGGPSDSTVLRRIKEALEAGTIERVWKYRTDAVGRRMPTLAYRPIEKGGKP